MAGNRVILGTVARLKGSLRMSLKTVLSAAMLLCTFSMLVGERTALAYPVPKPVPSAWELKFKTFDGLHLFRDPADDRLYWYLIYEVANQSGSDQLWVPDIVMYTDTGIIMKSGRGVRTRVTESILSLISDPLLESQDEIIGDLRQGNEYARRGIAVWPQPIDQDPPLGDSPVSEDLTNRITLFVGGLSGETSRVIHPTSGKPYILRKSLQMDFEVYGNLRHGQKVEPLGSKWVIR